jgi:polysaccharide biosynthesis protein PslA
MAEVTNDGAVGDVRSAWSNVHSLSDNGIAGAWLPRDHSSFLHMPRQSGLPYLWQGGSPVLPTSSLSRSAQLLVKRFSDVVLASIGLLLLAPLLLAVAAAVKLTSEGPVLFKQTRPGLGGRHFSVLKFRTMYTELGDSHGVKQTIVNDARVTPLGRILRRMSIDELPQLINVVLGDMSIIGPRPHPVNMLAGGRDYRELVPYYDLRHEMKPGLSGWAQANGYRGPTDDAERARARIDHDLAYIQNFSIALDFRIILMTLKKELLGGSGF